MQNLRKVPKDLDYLKRYIPYVSAYYNAHTLNAKLDVSETMLKIAYKLNLSETEMGNLEYFVGITRTKKVGIVYAVENFKKVIALSNRNKVANARNIAESQFWLARHDIGYRKYDQAEQRLANAVELLTNNGEENQLLRNEALQLLSMIKIKQNDIKTADLYYQQIITPEGHQGYLVPVNKPESYNAMRNAFLQQIPAVVEVNYDVDMFGKTFNINIPYLEVAQRNWTAAVGFEEYSRYITDLVASISYLSPHKNGEKIFVRDVKETLVFRPQLSSR